MNIVTAGLVTLATLRLTRLVTTDWFGEWTIVRPIKRWAAEHEANRRRARGATLHAMRHDYGDLNETAEKVVTELEATLAADEPISVPGRLAHGLDCPHCVGFWLGGAVLVAERSLRHTRAGGLLRLGLSALALSYVTGHISQRLD